MEKEEINIYKEYMAIKLHFQDDTYDYFKYHGSVKVPKDLNPKVKFCLSKIFSRNTSKEEYRLLFLSNIVSGRKYVLDYLCTKEAQNVKDRYKESIKDIYKVISLDSQKIKDGLAFDKTKFSELLKIKDGQHPLLLKYFYAKEISLETVIGYDILFKFMDKWDGEIKDPILYPETKLLIKKYKPFLSIDKDKVKDVIENIFLKTN